MSTSPAPDSNTLAIGTTIHDETVEIRRSPQNPDRWGLFLNGVRTGTADTFEGQLVRAAGLVPTHRRAPGLPSPLIEGDVPPTDPDPKALERALDAFLDSQPVGAYDVKAESPEHLEVDVWYDDPGQAYAGRYQIGLDGTAERIDLRGRARAAAEERAGTLGRLYRIWDRLRESRPDTFRDDFRDVLGLLMDAGPDAANDRLVELLTLPEPAPAPAATEPTNPT